MLDDFSPSQQKIIKRYYSNQDALMFQKLAELVSDLYLAEGKGRAKVWKSLVLAMQKLGVGQGRIDHLVKQDNPALVAELVKELEGKNSAGGQAMLLRCKMDGLLVPAAFTDPNADDVVARDGDETFTLEVVETWFYELVRATPTELLRLQQAGLRLLRPARDFRWDRTGRCRRFLTPHYNGRRTNRYCEAKLMLRSLMLLAAVSASTLAAADAPFPPPKNLGDASKYGQHVQRTMRLLATSTPEQPNTVRILFYGQSITEQKWTQLVLADLKQRYPHANIIAENRAIGGFASQLLIKTAETDLYSFYPDLIIFHVYGAHDKYEEIIRRIRTRTTAEIIQQNDHVTKEKDFTEETDPAKLPPKGEHWDAFMNHNFLPSIAKKYHTEFCDQRTAWKQYLRDYKLEPKQLLSDAVHLNKHGEYLMAECVKAHLRYDENLKPEKPEQDANTWVKTVVVGKDVKRTEGKTTLSFTGNRVVALVKHPSVPTRPDTVEPVGGEQVDFAFTIDGKKPTDLANINHLTRTTSYPGTNWPCILLVQADNLRLIEDWTLTITECSAGHKLVKFRVQGSVTGFDGDGDSSKPFVSASGRVVINPDDWHIERCFKQFKRPLPDRFSIKWSVIPDYNVATNFPKPFNGEIELIHGLPNGTHTMELFGSSFSGIRAFRIYTPPLKVSP